jgi:hypothetical protein
MTKKKSKGFLEDGGQRMILAAVAGGKALAESFTKCFDLYKEKHETSEKKEEGGWLEDFPKNTLKSMEELLRHLSKVPKEMADTYLEEEEEEKEEVTKKEPKTGDKEKDKEEKGKEESGEKRKAPVETQGKTPAKAVTSKKSKP